MATVYVSTTGLDTRTYVQAQSTSTPWRTVAKALADCAVGDTIEQRGGTYSSASDTFLVTSRDTVTIQNYAGEAVINENAGTSTTWIWLFRNCRPSGILVRKNPSGGSMTFRHNPTPAVPSASVTPGGKNFAGIWVQWASGSTSTVGMTANTQASVTVDGVTVTNMRGKCIFGDATGVIARNNDLSHGSAGVMVDGGGANAACNGTLIEDNEIHHMDKLWQDNRMGTEGDDAGAMGIHINRHSSGAIVRRNSIHDNTTYSSVYGRDGAGFEPFRSQNWDVYENEFYDNEIVIETGTATGYANLQGGKFHHNYVHGFICTDSAGPGFLFRTGNGTKFYNNTIVMSGAQSGTDPDWIVRFRSESGGFGDAVVNLDVFNNIIANSNVVPSPGNLLYLVDGSPVPTFTRWNYNLYYSPYPTTSAINYNGGAYVLSSAGLSAFRFATVFGDNDIWAQDPLLNGDGTLQAGSPAINAGLHVAGLTDGYVGAAPDIGAFEYTTSSGSETAEAIAATGIGSAPGASVNSGQARLRITMG